MKRPSLPSTTRGRLFGIFCIYMVLLFGFAGVYDRIYQGDRNSFFVQAAVSAPREQEKAKLVDLTQGRLRALELSCFLLAEFKKTMPTLRPELSWGIQPNDERNPSHVDFDASITVDPSLEARSSSYTFVFRTPRQPDQGFSAEPPGTTGVVLDIYSPRGKSRGWYGAYINTVWSDTPEQLRVDKNQFARLIDVYRAKTDQDLSSVRKTLQAQTWNREQLWTYVDFVYFSAITIGTVGYGDIVPNSSTVRLVVVAQIIISAFLFIVLLNVALNRD